MLVSYESDLVIAYKPRKKFSRFWPSKQVHHLESVGEDQRIRRIRVARPVPLIDQICRLLIVNVNPVYPSPI
jgi:hypothetical protein